MTRKLKVAIHLILIVLCILILSAMVGTDSPTPEIAFRRKEKQQMIGPAEIVTTMEVRHSWYDRMMVGISPQGFTVFSWHGDRNFDGGLLRYYPKDGPVTVFCANSEGRLPGSDDAQIPFFILTDHAQAVKAVLKLELTDEGQTQVLELEARRSEGGYFLLSLYRNQLSDKTRWALETALSPNYVGGTVSAQVTLYDWQGNEIDSLQTDLTKP